MKKILSLGLLCASLAAAPLAAHADTFQVSYLPPGTASGGNQAPTATTFYETFDNSFSGTTTFNGSGVTGTYTGQYSNPAANQYGGAGGAGKYITTPSVLGSTYTLTLTQGTTSTAAEVNYFGFWLSALDAGNKVQFYNGNVLEYTYINTNLINALGSCNVSNPYCGNPNTAFLGQNGGQQYAYLNFYDATGTFDKVVFTETISGAGYESDNHAVAGLTGPPGGTPLNPVPEPSSLLLMGTGILGVAGSLRRKFAK